jgi:hypothetical protein
MAKRTVRSNGGSLISSSNHPTGCGEDPTDDTSTQTVSSAGMLGLKAEAAAQTQVLAAFTYKGVASTLQRVWVEEGAQGLMKGMAPRCFYSACFSALGFFTFETTWVYLHMKHLEKKKITLEEKLDVKLT